MRVRRNVRAYPLGLLDRDAHLLERIRRGLQAGAGRDAAGGEELEEIGAWKRFSRAPARISSTPSSADFMRPWPLLAAIGRVAMTRFGPSSWPASIASRV